MHRRHALLALTPLPLAARAHHGWSSFDQSRPLYLEGKAAKVAWRNPHVEFELEVTAGLKLPADLAARALPAQTAPVDGPGLLKAATLPQRADRRWTIELAPLTRMEAWGVPPLKPGDSLALIGFGLSDAKAAPVLRAEYLFVGGKTYGLRSSPA